ncbi:MAG: DUF2339 domain-containing protein [Bacteroidia bacterium]|nr:DUF2339 domain-containing protein [Bacteroidia bacterium]
MLLAKLAEKDIRSAFSEQRGEAYELFSQDAILQHPAITASNAISIERPLAQAKKSHIEGVQRIHKLYPDDIVYSAWLANPPSTHLIHSYMDDPRIEELSQRLDLLLQRQEDFGREIAALRTDLRNLRSPSPSLADKPSGSSTLAPLPDLPAASLRAEAPVHRYEKKAKAKPSRFESINWEKFVGENLISKIGIVITVIGVAIGAKYSIDNNLISPLTRIILGYLAGIGLLGAGMYLRATYQSYSAVLVSGAMATMYFITFAAYNFYGLFPQPIAFSIMVIFTVFTVVAALQYNQVVIAHIGLVGAYAIPLLLSDGSGRIAIFFSYMAILNAGILAVAVKKYWKSLYYIAFGLTWLTMLSWYALDYRSNLHLGLGLTFAIIFFVTFYLTVLAYKLLQNEQFNRSDIILLLLNSFVFFGLGFAIIDGADGLDKYLGVFTLANAVVHFGVGYLIYRKNLADKSLFYLVAGLVLVFVTITVPVQLDGNWVTMLWIGEAVLLFWIGRSRGVSTYEKMAYPLILLALISLAQDWQIGYSHWIYESEFHQYPIYNIYFLTSMMVLAGLGWIYWFGQKKEYAHAFKPESKLPILIGFLLGAVVLLVSYTSFFLEIQSYWDQRFLASELAIRAGESGNETYRFNYDLRSFSIIWLANYSLLFGSVLALIHQRWIKNPTLGLVSLGGTALALLVFLSQGLYELSELRESYLSQALGEYYHIGIFHILIRYLSFVFVAIALFSAYKTLQKQEPLWKNIFDIVFHSVLLWILCSELIHWMDFLGDAEKQSYKLGISILCGLYALLLIGLGIWKAKQHLRIAAIALFGVTLVKLFFFDIAHMDTITKTIVFVSLGVLLLIISFLYNKYKHLIDDESKR